MNNINAIGNLTRDPELGYIGGNGTPSVKFTIAVNRNYKNKDGSIPVDFIPVQAIGKIAEAIANYTKKGSKVAVTGSMRIDQYQDKEGKNRTFAKIQAERVDFLSQAQTGQGQTQAQPQQATFNPADVIDDNDLPF